MDFHLDVMVSLAAMRMCVIKGLNWVGTLWIPMLSKASFGDGCMIRPEIVVIREKTAFQKLLTPLQFHSICRMPPFSQQFLQHVEADVGSVCTILTGVKYVLYRIISISSQWFTQW